MTPTRRAALLLLATTLPGYVTGPGTPAVLPADTLGDQVPGRGLACPVQISAQCEPHGLGEWSRHRNDRLATPGLCFHRAVSRHT
jgi:hypothetical protein